MNIKSLLIGSAAALATVSGSYAADAVVAAEPEPMEYVRVCDAYGAGYFYIPGTGNLPRHLRLRLVPGRRELGPHRPG
ncbi:MAG: porin [Phyllobacteriaceae bacterium]|nr:porin [Phyllobacteriaceae bacterium]